MNYDLKTFRKIAEGWTNFVFQSESVKELAEVRAKICSTCTHAKEMVLPITGMDSIKEARSIKCDKCGCPVSAKVRVINEECPLPEPDKKW